MIIKKFPRQKFDVVVIDPPWKLKKLTHKKRPNQTGFDYPTMSCRQISQLPVDRLLKPSSWVFLWTIQKYLYDAPEILARWGCKLLATGVWEKTYGRSSGMPLYGFRWNAEFFLIGYVDKPLLWPKRKLIPLAFSAENEGHSKKPDRFYQQVETLGSTRIDIFARRTRPGWSVWGNEV